MDLDQSIDKIEDHLESLDTPSFDTIDFDWEGIRFHAAARGASSGGEIRIKARMGSLYYTIEDPVQRSLAIERVYATNRGIDGAYRIDNKGNVHFESVTTTDGTVTGTDLMSALTVILLESETHLRGLRAHLKPA